MTRSMFGSAASDDSDDDLMKTNTVINKIEFFYKFNKDTEKDSLLTLNFVQGLFVEAATVSQ